MSTNHDRCICATCSKEMKPGQSSMSGHSPSQQYLKLDTSLEPASGKPKNSPHGWNDRLLEWTKVVLKFGYLLLAFFKT